jgi:hypothetical protein
VLKESRLVTYNMHFVANYLIIVGVVTNLVLIALQIGTYRKTKHRSLAVMAFASTLGLLYVLASYEARQFWASGHNPLAFYLLAAALLTVQSLTGVWSVWSLFRAFEQAHARRGSA